jgi:hypothetical protein
MEREEMRRREKGGKGGKWRNGKVGNRENKNG